MGRYDEKTMDDVRAVLLTVSDDEAVLRLLGYCVGRVLLRAAAADPEAFDALAVRADHGALLDHVGDWLRSALLGDEAWLRNTDDLGRPRKLMKFADLASIGREADKAMLKAAARLGGVRLVEGDEELHMDLGNGYSLVRLLTPAALDRESAEMQHCIGHGSYDEMLSDGGCSFLSLRDGFGKAHATMEISGDRIEQYQGKQNKAPNVRYTRVLKPFFEATGMFPARPAVELGVVFHKGSLHEFDALPDGLAVPGDLVLTKTGDIRLPEGLSVGRKLDIRSSGIRRIGDGTVVGWSLLAQRSALEYLPDGLELPGDLGVSGSALKSLPSRLVVFGELLALNCEFEELPEDIVVYGTVNLNGSSIRRLPRRFVCRGDLILSSCRHLEALPEGLKVAGNLDITGSSLKALPDNLSIGGDLLMAQTAISELSRHGVVRGHVDAGYTAVRKLGGQMAFKSLNLCGTPIRAVPGGLRVEGLLNLKGSEARTLGPDIRVGSLDMGETRVTDLPADLVVRERADFYDSDLTTIPAGYTHPGRLDIGMTLVKRLPENLDIGELHCHGLKDLSIGSNLSVRADFFLGESTVVAWEGPASVGNLVLNEARVAALPDGLKIAGYLAAERAHVAVWPSRLEVFSGINFSGGTCERMPDYLRVGASVDFSDVKGGAAPGIIECGATVNMNDAAFKTFPSEITAVGAISLDGSTITHVPAAYHAGTHLRLSNAKELASLEPGLHAGKSLILRGSAIRTVPAGVTFGEAAVFLDRIERRPAPSIGDPEPVAQRRLG